MQITNYKLSPLNTSFLLVNKTRSLSFKTENLVIINSDTYFPVN